MVNNCIFPIEKMCKVLKVSRSSYYSWLVHEPGMLEKENDELSKRIKWYMNLAIGPMVAPVLQ
jgi:putative transposase